MMAVLTVLMCFASANAFAQLTEVRGVQTRVVEYKSDNYDNYDLHGKRHGFEFKNENTYPVWVEAELCTNGYWKGEIRAGTYDTKSFTLQAGESYVWKVGDKMIKFLTGSAYYDKSDQYYVKYRAYKTE